MSSCAHPGFPGLPLDCTDVPNPEAAILIARTASDQNLMCKRFSPRLASSTPDASLWFFRGPSSALGGLACPQLGASAYFWIKKECVCVSRSRPLCLLPSLPILFWATTLVEQSEGYAEGREISILPHRVWAGWGMGVWKPMSSCTQPGFPITRTEEPHPKL